MHLILLLLNTLSISDYVCEMISQWLISGIVSNKFGGGEPEDFGDKRESQLMQLYHTG